MSVDTIYGETGADSLCRRVGLDTLCGADDADRLYGGGGANLMYGGTVGDAFVFAAQSDMGIGVTRDFVLDFTGRSDKLDANGVGHISLSAAGRSRLRTSCAMSR